MGRDKAFLSWQGQTLLGRALKVTRAVASSATIVGARSKFLFYGAVAEDVYAERGPLGGIHAALQATDQELNLVLAVDLPFVSPSLLTYLIERARGTPALAIVPRLDAGWEPLCAVYRKPFATLAEAALQQGQNAIHPLLEGSDDGACVHAISERELSDSGFPARMFQNINTTTDLESLRDSS
jgi:molybdopterin-guanine dinucleotide biosynthesis protein A